MKHPPLLTSLLLLFALPLSAQTGSISGRVLKDGEAMKKVTILLWHGTELIDITDGGTDGNFQFTGLQQGFYRMMISPVEYYLEKEVDSIHVESNLDTRLETFILKEFTTLPYYKPTCGGFIRFEWHTPATYKKHDPKMYVMQHYFQRTGGRYQSYIYRSDELMCFPY